MPLPVQNIAADLQRNARLEAVMRGFKRRITPILAFAFSTQNKPLEGTNSVAVPFYDLDAAASKDFSADDGYVFDADSTTGSRKVEINKRKYKTLYVSSSDLSRQPALDPVKLLEIKGEKLAEDIVTDVFSLVTLANYGAAAVNVAAAGFDSDDIADLRGVCNTAMWPSAGRALVLNADFDTALFKDSSIKNALNFGTASAIQDGSIARISGFDYYDCPSLPANAENLVGFAAFMSALLFGQAPIEPAPAVRQQMAVYEQIPVEVAPGVNILLEYKQMGDPFKDRVGEVLECNYGYALGNAAALKRITKP